MIADIWIECHGSLDMGQSLVVDADIGVGASTRNAFWQHWDSEKTLQPTPLCLLLVGTAQTVLAVDLILYWECVAISEHGAATQ